MKNKKQKLLDIIVQFATDICIYLEKEKFNKAWNKLCKRIDKLNLFQEK